MTPLYLNQSAHIVDQICESDVECRPPYFPVRTNSFLSSSDISYIFKFIANITKYQYNQLIVTNLIYRSCLKHDIYYSYVI